MNGSSTHERPLGLKLIIAYKLIKAPIMLLLAIWLTAAPAGALRLGEHWVHQLSEGGVLFARAGRWLATHLSKGSVTGATLLAWLDGATTALEGILLLLGKAWGEWIVIGGLSLFLPLELVSLERHPGPGKVAALAVNSAVVAYLVWRRVRREQA